MAFVPGSAFFAEAPRSEFLRLNYSNRPPELIDQLIFFNKVAGKQLQFFFCGRYFRFRCHCRQCRCRACSCC